ncbi:MAG: cyclic nucleotide-binding domain-containing protein [Bdellovibrionales bacterium]|nr:cyclic nucleotide-binding domain-containing protein [Bdellovibrionales bacterium]
MSANQNSGQQSEQIEQVQFRAGDILFQGDETSFHFFIIQEGEVEIFKRGPGGEELQLAKVSAGNSLGEFAMLDRKPRSASARAITDIVAARVSPEAYEQLLSELPDWAVSVMRALVERVRHTNDIVRALQSGLEKTQSSTSLGRAASKAMDAAEYSDTSRTSRIKQAEADETVTDFDFSVYESSGPTPAGAKKS